ncbi:MAG: TolC family protein [Deltaproteobacteria bacterium]|nr:TolC family protein [Deltaproteobacteria bacterium]
MDMRFFLVVVSVLVFCWGSASAAPMTLQQCIIQGLAENPEIKAYRLQVDEAKEGVREAVGAFLPTLSLNYTRSELSNGASNERDTDYLDQNSDSMSARVSQPLFTGFSGLAGLKKARQNKEFRRYELQYMHLQLVRNIHSSFYDILRAEEHVKKWQGSVGRLEEQRRIAQAWFDQQLAPRLRVLEVEVELSNARQELIAAESKLVIAQANLRQALYLAGNEPLDIDGSLESSITESCSDVESCVELGLERRPDLRLAAFNIDMARQEARIIAARNLPQVSLDASYVDYQRDYDDRRFTDDDRDYYTLSLNVSMRPFQGGRNISAYRRQRLVAQRQEEMLLQRRQVVVTEVRTTFQQLQESRSRLKVAADTLAEAREAYQVASRSVKLGISSLSDLLDAELRLTRAEINMIDTRHALHIAAARFHYAVGGK